MGTAIKRLPRYAGDVRILQIVTQEELSPNYSGDVRLLDRETGNDVNVTMSSRVLSPTMQDVYYMKKNLKPFAVALVFDNYN